MKKLIVLLGLVAVVSGCQSVPKGTTTALDNESFMGLWGRYSRCQAGTDLATMQVEVQHLQTIAATDTEKSRFNLTLPKQVRRYVSEPPTRLAVDPKAMAAACTLYTGQIAAEMGKADIASSMFQAILKHQGQPAYEYYVAQALTGLAQLDLAMTNGGSARAVRTGNAPSGDRLGASSVD